MVTSSYYLMCKFPTVEGITIVYGHQDEARGCHLTATKSNAIIPMEKGSHPDIHMNKVKSIEETEAVKPWSHQDETLLLGKQLEEGVRREILNHLAKN